MCVQCAILYDELDWTHEQIGQRFGWAIQDPAIPGYKMRCETARDHIAEGREILEQRKQAD